MRGITDHSPVAAGGIANVSPIGQAVMLTADDRLCGSLTLSIQGSFHIPFGIQTPDLATLRLRGVPCILLSGLSSGMEGVSAFDIPARIRVPKVQGVVYIIPPITYTHRHV